jgi:ATP:corrinoid adenosyltransferase
VFVPPQVRRHAWTALAAAWRPARAKAQDLWQQALQAFLKEQARFYNIERLRLCQKYGVASLQEMDELVAQGRVEEEIILTDFQRVDFLTSKLRQLNDLMATA